MLHSRTYVTKTHIKKLGIEAYGRDPRAAGTETGGSVGPARVLY